MRVGDAAASCFLDGRRNLADGSWKNQELLCEPFRAEVAIRSIAREGKEACGMHEQSAAQR